MFRSWERSLLIRFIVEVKYRSEKLLSTRCFVQETPDRTLVATCVSITSTTKHNDTRSCEVTRSQPMSLVNSHMSIWAWNLPAADSAFQNTHCCNMNPCPNTTWRINLLHTPQKDVRWTQAGGSQKLRDLLLVHVLYYDTRLIEISLQLTNQGSLVEKKPWNTHM